MANPFEIEMDPRFERFLNKAMTVPALRTLVIDLRDAFLDYMVDEVFQELKQNLEHADTLGFDPVSQAWLDKKRDLRQSEALFHATEQLAESLTKSVNGNEAFVGWDDEPHAQSGEPLSTIAAALDLGVADLNIPERPIVRQSIAAARSRFRPRLMQIAQEVTNKFMQDAAR